MHTDQMTGVDLSAQLSDVVINYDDLGKGEIPILFIHGFPFDKSMWKPQMEVLSKSFRTIAYDIRGYGKSENGNQEISISLFARDLVAFMDVLSIDKAIVCGLSMGGYILLNAVNSNPERFKAIILCDTQCIADTPETKKGRYQTIEKFKSGNLNDFAEGFIPKVFYSDTIDNQKDVVTKISDIILNTSLTTFQKSLAALAERMEMCTKLQKFSLPTLILCGEYDVVTPPEQARLLQSEIVNSQLHIIENAGHLSNLEQPVDFNNHISNFVKSISI